MTEGSARSLLAVVNTTNSILVAFGLVAAACATFSFSRNFNNWQEILLVGALWMYPLTCFVSIPLSRHLFHSKRLATACIVALLPLVPVLTFCTIFTTSDQ